MNDTIISTPDFQIVEVTPELAKKWLHLNTENRPVKTVVTAYANDMRLSRWLLNGEAIKFAGPAYEPTKLLDGQNRLHAVIKANVTVKLAVAFNVQPGAQSTMDSGVKRSVADALAISGIKNSTTVAAAGALALRVQLGRLNGGTVDATNAAIEAFIYDNPSLIDSGNIARLYAHRTDVPPGTVTYTHWVLSRIDADAATDFWRAAAEKTGLVAGDPVIALTERFAEARRSRERIPVPGALSAIYRAWNYRRSGKSLRLIRINAPRGGLVDIPEPR